MLFGLPECLVGHVIIVSGHRMQPKQQIAALAPLSSQLCRHHECNGPLTYFSCPVADCLDFAWPLTEDVKSRDRQRNKS